MPWKRSTSISRASRSSPMTSAPPSIDVMFLFGWKLKMQMSPKLPMRLPRHDEPMASAASSMTRSLCFAASA